MFDSNSGITHRDTRIPMSNDWSTISEFISQESFHGYWNPSREAALHDRPAFSLGAAPKHGTPVRLVSVMLGNQRSVIGFGRSNFQTHHACHHAPHRGRSVHPGRGVTLERAGERIPRFLDDISWAMYLGPCIFGHVARQLAVADFAGKQTLILDLQNASPGGGLGTKPGGALTRPPPGIH